MIIPASVLSARESEYRPPARRIIDPQISQPASLCWPNTLPTSPAALAVRRCVSELVVELHNAGKWPASRYETVESASISGGGPLDGRQHRAPTSSSRVAQFRARTTSVRARLQQPHRHSSSSAPQGRWSALETVSSRRRDPRRGTRGCRPAPTPRPPAASSSVPASPPRTHSVTRHSAVPRSRSRAPRAALPPPAIPHTGRPRRRARRKGFPELARGPRRTAQSQHLRHRLSP
ncbi:LysR family transcriptional regulator [Burkholderia pseudomallei]|nr:LysR family transcriptional regulator [Burkholderia pseudomallei]VBH41905.1 LysR family transcriptional regulator [Burkholderia pseudomallei]VBI57022.1 LysR family transcriptional regulator [Burkholderia pseudomallei]